MRRGRLLLALMSMLVSGCDRPPPPSEAGVELLAILGDRDGAGALPSTPLVSPEINGYYLVTISDGPTEEPPRLFDSTGRFVRVIGRLGEGPNEYRRPGHIHRVNDSAWIYDMALRRITALLPPDTIGPTRLWPLTPHSLLPLADGTFVLSEDRWGSGPPMSHVDGAGERLQVFGDTLPTGTRDWRWVHLAAAPDSGFWSAPPFWHLQFQYWSGPGRLGRTLSLERDYFTEYTKHAQRSPTTPPDPSLTGFWTDSTGALWIVVMVPDPEWPASLGPPMQAEGQTIYPIEDWNRAYDTVIERVDSENGASLASWRIDQAIVRVVEPWVLQSIRTDEDGWYQALLWQVPH